MNSLNVESAFQNLSGDKEIGEGANTKACRKVPPPVSLCHDSSRMDSATAAGVALQSNLERTPLAPAVLVDLLEEVLEERGNHDRRQGILPDRKPAIERRSSIPRRKADRN